MVGAGVGAQHALIGEPLREAGHAAGPPSLHALDRAADRVGVEQRHRVQRAQHVAVCRVHGRGGSDAAAQRLASVGMLGRCQQALEAAALAQVGAEGVEQPAPRRSLRIGPGRG